ncbi:MAG: phosphate/phosphite/phosphonate ABC transporter substrate-binding protein [Phycisphaeraceae bacterium]
MFKARSILISRLLLASLLVLAVGVVVWGLACPGPKVGDGAGAVPPADNPPLRLALIPERDVFIQRQRYQALAAYLSQKLDRPVQLVTLNTYSSVLDELAHKTIDGGFLGSMVAVLAHDRLDAQVLVKPQHAGHPGHPGSPAQAGGLSTYRGVLIVRDDSPIQSVADLRGRSLAMVRTTTAGNLFPLALLAEHQLLGDGRPAFRWVGTHDDVAQAVMDGQVDAGAMKDLRLDAFEKDHPQAKLRRVAVSAAMPDNALVVRGDLDAALVAQLRQAMLGMDSNADGKAVLAGLDNQRFVACEMAEYQAVYDMTRTIGSAWDQVGVEGPPPGP